MTEILVKVHCNGEALIYRFDSIERAAKDIRGDHKDDSIEYVLEIERTAFDCPRGFSAQEDFEKAWNALEYADAMETNPFENGTLRCDHYLDEHMQAPIFTDQRIPVSRGLEKLEAAE